jgi:DNA sulfur modification protein DndC
MSILKEITDDDQVHFELVRELLVVERSYRTSSRRAKLFERLEEAFKRGFYEDVEDATQRATRRRTLDGLVEAIGAARGDIREAATVLEEALDNVNIKPQSGG